MKILPDELIDKITEVKHIFITACDPTECFTLFSVINESINESRMSNYHCFLKNYKKQFNFLGISPTVIVEINKPLIEMPGHIHAQIKEPNGSTFGLEYSWVIIRYHKESQDGPVLEMLRSHALPFAIRSLADDVWAKPHILSPFLLNRIEAYSIKAEGVVKIDRVRPWFKDVWERKDLEYDEIYTDYFETEPF